MGLVVNRSYASRGPEETLGTHCPFCSKDNPTLCSGSCIQLPTSKGWPSPQEKECSGRWFRIKLLFPHENFICIAFQINMSVKLKGRLLFADMSRNSPFRQPALVSRYSSITPFKACRERRLWLLCKSA
uniref:Uncharacterized protein n=1 Tax=Rousettus aegyptiacus TaxID=9407 RepID=A0A7J8D6L8_ROUAE|nr:hypothetical protein HJG63_008767 [Rousettus aegyptiacus]